MRTLTAQQARRAAVRAQLLDAPRPVDPEAVLHRLTFLQVDLTAAVHPHADLAMWTRLGQGWRSGDADRSVAAGWAVEHDGVVRPTADLGLHRAEMAVWPGLGELPEWATEKADWMVANDDFRRDLLEQLADEGPLAARDLPDTAVVPWRSSGWNNGKNVLMMLEGLARRGEVAVAGREGRERVWLPAERVWPEVETVPLEQAFATRSRRALAALGIARARRVTEGTTTPEAEQVRVEGTRGTWLLDPGQAELLEADFTGRVALLSPLDRLVFDRTRTGDLFAFDYQLEMYKPAAQRRWGYWAMPVLVGDRLVGKLDATADRERGVLTVTALHEDGAWTDADRAAVHDEVDALADWLDLVPERD